MSGSAATCRRTGQTGTCFLTDFAFGPGGRFSGKSANSFPEAYLCLTLKAVEIIVGLA
jgi:hypothetical protein